MTLWALAQRRNLGEAWSLLEHAERSGRAMSALCFSALLAECEQRGLLREEIGLLRGLVDTVEGADAKALVAATAGAASMREEAGQPQPQQGSQGVAKYPRVAPAPAFGGGGEVDEPWITHMREAAAAHPPAPGTPYWKELRLLAHVLNTARRGDPGSVCAAIETFGEDVLNPSGLWLKVAGGGKADVLAAGVRRAPPKGSILEIGTYCGYSALRMATARPGTRIVTLEVDPAHMVIARNIVAYAGLGHMIDVWTGHSKDVLHRLPARYGGRIEFCAVFMDQKGSRYDEDLDTLEHHRLLKPGAVVMADNVLKPGSPLFLWRLTKSGAYKTDIVRVKEFAMPSEDWMSVSVRNEIQDGASDGTTDELEGVVREGVVRPPEPPEELVQMQWESDRIRSKATRAGHGVSFQEWAAYAEQVKQRLDKYGIEATIDSADL